MTWGLTYFDELIILGSHRLEKYLNLEGFLENSLKTKSALETLENHFDSHEKSFYYMYLLYNFTLLIGT